MNKKLIIFDMDGLMIDSEQVTFVEYSKVLQRHGYAEMDIDFYISMIGLNQRSIESDMVAKYGEDFPFKTIASEVHDNLEKQFKVKVPLKDGLLETLNFLKESGYIMAVATSSSRERVDIILKDAKISKYFSVTVCGDEIEKGKPAPEIFLKCCKFADVEPKHAVVLEDSEPGILAAHNAGIDCIVVPDMKYPEDKFKAMAASVIDTLHDAAKAIESLESL